MNKTPPLLLLVQEGEMKWGERAWTSRWRWEDYRYEVKGPVEFVQQIEHHVARGYRFYRCNMHPRKKFYLDNPEPGKRSIREVDQRIIEEYGIAMPSWQRSKRKNRKLEGKPAPMANLHYVRCGYYWALLATDGEHSFFERENPCDMRVQPIRFRGYEIWQIKGVDGKFHASVRIQESEYKRMLAHFVEHAEKWSYGRLLRELRGIWFESWYPVNRQKRDLFKAVSKKRRARGLPGISEEDLEQLQRNRRRRKVYVKAT